MTSPAGSVRRRRRRHGPQHRRGLRFAAGKKAALMIPPLAGAGRSSDQPGERPAYCPTTYIEPVAISGDEEELVAGASPRSVPDGSCFFASREAGLLRDRAALSPLKRPSEGGAAAACGATWSSPSQRRTKPSPAVRGGGVGDASMINDAPSMVWKAIDTKRVQRCSKPPRSFGFPIPTLCHMEGPVAIWRLPVVRGRGG